MLTHRPALGFSTTLSCRLLSQLPAHANIAISSNVSSATQTFDNLFGIDFNVNATPIQITQLGAFDNNADGILLTDSTATPIVVQIWNRDTGLAVASASFSSADPGTDTTVGAGKFFFRTLDTPVTLAAGGHYYLSEDYAGNEKFGNVGNPGYSPATADSSGLITFVGKGRASNVHNAMFNGNDAASGGTSTASAPPATNNGFLDSGPATRYTGPNFVFTAVPEPASLSLLALAALLPLRRRRPTPR
jgi:hypothetical protein